MADRSRIDSDLWETRLSIFGPVDTLEEEEIRYLVCDNCGNDSWYIVVPSPYGKADASQVQICTKCGFAVEIAYKPIKAQILDTQ